MKKLTPALSLKKRGRTAKPKVLIALSGGIDSAVSAYLLIKQGCEVEAAFMKNWSSTAGLLRNECPWLVDRQDALRVAAFLRIPMHTLDFEKQYQKNVMDYFFKEYQAGRTPNPDVMCNKEIKFKLLYEWARKNGFDYLATGHYARVQSQVVSRKSIVFSLETKDYRLVRSADEFKDQTYFIYNIKTEQLPHIMFPVGGMKKSQVRLLAKKIGLPNAEKKESMGLCFVGKIRLKDFLEQKLKPKAGQIVLVSPVSSRRSASDMRDPELSSDWIPDILSDALKDSGMTASRLLGQHQGLHNYTIGQRQGIKVGGGGPYYVLRKNLKSNTLFVTDNPNDQGLLTKEIQIHSVNWIEQNLKFKILNFKLTGRFRHQGELVPLTINQINKDHYQVIFAKPQKAIASGQSLVLYRGKECVGGGVIV